LKLTSPHFDRLNPLNGAVEDSAQRAGRAFTVRVLDRPGRQWAAAVLLAGVCCVSGDRASDNCSFDVDEATLLAQRRLLPNREDAVEEIEQLKRAIEREQVNPNGMCRLLANQSIAVRITRGRDDGVLGHTTLDGRYISISERVFASNDSNLLSTVLRHELAHLVILRRIPSEMAPLWYHEGLAHLLSGSLDCDAHVVGSIELEAAIASGTLEDHVGRRLQGADPYIATLAVALLHGELTAESLGQLLAQLRRHGFDKVVVPEATDDLVARIALDPELALQPGRLKSRCGSGVVD
jgi:hypothetical protein